MPRPRPTRVLHFTHIDHIEPMVASGVTCDAEAQRELLAVEVGDTDIKARRRRLEVPAGPGGVVADYVPFYFAPRSPMMYVIHNGRVPQYQGPVTDLVYLVASIEGLQAAGCDLVLSDRNAAVGIADFSASPDDWDDLVDWSVMDLTMWNSVPEYPDRMERRMAECLAHGRVPWHAVEQLVVATPAHETRVVASLAALGATIPVSVRRNWYF